MTLYAGVILLTELLMISMIVHVVNYSGFTKIQKRWYLMTFSAVVICAAAEFLALHYDGASPMLSLPLTIITILQFSLTPMLPVFFAGALGMHREAMIAGTVCSLNVVAEIVSAPFGWIFYFDDAGKYVRGPYYSIYIFFYVASLAFLIVCLGFIGKRFRRRDVYTIVMVFVIMAAAILPLLLFKIYTDYLGIGISACLCYIYYNDLIQEDIKAELVDKQTKISSMQTHIISGLSNLIENRDTETGEHVARTSAYVRTLARTARAEGVYADELTDEYIERLYRLAPMHDIGKIVVSDSILKKPGRLTDEEFDQMKRHASEGGKVIHEVLNGLTDEDALNTASEIAMFHHERWDGTGYPARLKGEEIPLAARIMAIADVYDALISERCYKKPMSREQAFGIIEEEAGTHFDPNLVKVFLNHKELYDPAKVAPMHAG